MRKYLRYFHLTGFALAVLALAPNTAGVYAAAPDPSVQKTFDKLLGAIKSNDMKAFVANATDAVKQGVTPQVMETMSKQLGARLNKGYQAAYLCSLKQQGHQVHLWKLTFKDKGDDNVVRLALKGGKVAGFNLQ
ncbi:MAG: hypothetical protein HY318_19305 [Armatimonadetes bacterium]|nr:hypothetical protein [Armatimonadota bacterium]